MVATDFVHRVPHQILDLVEQPREASVDETGQVRQKRAGRVGDVFSPLGKDERLGAPKRNEHGVVPPRDKSLRFTLAQQPWVGEMPFREKALYVWPVGICEQRQVGKGDGIDLAPAPNVRLKAPFPILAGSFLQKFED